jgi:hypothetical protein
MVQLTLELASAIHSAGREPLAVFDPASQQTFYIVTAHDRELLRELVEEERVVSAFVEASSRDVISRLKEAP